MYYISCVLKTKFDEKIKQEMENYIYNFPQKGISNEMRRNRESANHYYEYSHKLRKRDKTGHDRLIRIISIWVVSLLLVNM